MASWRVFLVGTGSILPEAGRGGTRAPLAFAGARLHDAAMGRRTGDGIDPGCPLLRSRLPWPLLAALLAGAQPAIAVTAPAEQTRQRDEYVRAVTALEARDWAAYEPLRGRLDDYPLALYLDYYRLTGNVGAVDGPAASRFAARSSDSPLRNRFLDRYLRSAGADRRWDDFLAAMPQPPRDVSLQCYYYRARYATGDQAAAFEGAAGLWVHGYSRPKTCDPLFDRWLAAGGATAERVWARLRLAFDARQRSLLRYVARLAPSALEADAEVLLALYREPHRLDAYRRVSDPGRRADALHLALRRLARYRPEAALEGWLRESGAVASPAEDAGETERRIAFHVLLERIDSAASWIDGRLAAWGDDTLTELRLRWLLREQDWPQLLAVAPALSEAAQASSRWRYWRGVALENTGSREAGGALLAAAAAERNYYGFLAAERLGEPYAFNHRPLEDAAPARTLAGRAGLRRVGELNYHGEARDAHAEWRYLLRAEDRDGRAGLARLAAAEGWHHLAIDAANEAAASDALELRFPLAFDDVFRDRGRDLGLPHSELMAIARRESAFFPQARSSAGARGLMQVLPSTGRAVARELGVPGAPVSLYRVEDNVLIGSAYYRQLLDRYGGNRVLALAAYNAGPNRVDNWRAPAPEAGLPLELWIETLPFRETRDYVKAVLAYRVVFDYLQGRETRVFRDTERLARY